MALDNWLRENMRKRGLNQAKLAKCLGIGQSTVSNWLQDLAIPKPEHVAALADLFGYDYGALLEMAGHPTGRSSTAPNGDEQQVVDRLKLLRGTPEHRPVIQIVISMIDLVLAAKDSTDGM